MRLNLKNCLHWSGSAIAIAGIAFVALRLREYGSEIDFARFGMVEWTEIVAFALIYGLANLMLAFAWRDLLEKFGAQVTNRWAIKTYGVSQLAKYVPGNIFHLAGRQAIGMAAGIPGWPLAKSTIWELGLIAIGGAVFGVLALPLVVSAVTSIGRDHCIYSDQYLCSCLAWLLFRSNGSTCICIVCIVSLPSLPRYSSG